MAYKYRPSAADRAAYGAKMAEIDQFCKDHEISASLRGDSYYFRLNGVDYRISNHTIEASNRGAFDDFGNQIRELYHDGGEADTVCITAGKTRIIDIYNDLAAGYKLDRRGNRITK